MAYTTPVTWANGAVTAASFNEQIRDNVTYLKAALDLLTNSTTADSGTATYISITRPTGADGTFIRALVSGDTQPRWTVYYDHSDTRVRMAWGAGGASVVDAFLERTSASIMTLTGGTTLDNVQAAVNTAFFRGQVSGDTTYYRFRAIVASAGGGEIDVGDGTASSTFGKFYYDVTNTQTVLASTAAGYVGSISLSLVAGSTKLVAIGETVTSGEFLFDPAAYKVSFGAGSITGNASNATLLFDGRIDASDGGVTTLVKAGTIADGDFPTVESGLIGVDTSNGFLTVREGSTWRGSDLRGDMVTLGPFIWTNLAASQTDLGGGYGVLGDAGAGLSRIIMPFAGAVVGLSVRGSAICTAGQASFRAEIGGSVDSGMAVLINTTDTVYNSASQAPTAATFAAGTSLSVVVSTTGAFLPVTSEYDAVLFVLLRRGSTYS